MPALTGRDVWAVVTASKNTVFYEKLAEAPQFAIIPTSTTNPGSDDFDVTNKKMFCDNLFNNL